MSRGGGPILGGARVKSRTSGPQWTGRRRKSNRFAGAGSPGTGQFQESVALMWKTHLQTQGRLWFLIP
jgi:hypothetical protein